MNECCTTGHLWTGTPTGREETLSTGHQAYIAGSNPKRAVFMIHDALGWAFKNTRLLADEYAKEVDATVYLPDFYNNWAVPADKIAIKIEGDKCWIDANQDFDWPGWMEKNGPGRYPEVLAVARALREKYEALGAVGFCWGGSAGFKMGSKEYAGLLDCITIAHPGPPEEEDVRKLGIPVQIIAPEWDPTFTQDKKDLCQSVIPTLGIEYVYHHFPGMVHGFCTKVDPSQEPAKKALEAAKRAVVWWLNTHMGR